MSAIDFKIEARAPGLRARAGTLTTSHGAIRTPAFTPVGTKANVKGILPSALRLLGAEVVLANTYHLYLQPGERIVQSAGGLGTFMGWSGPTMTDSGGFQVFSLGAGFGKTISKFGNFISSDSDEGLAKSNHGKSAIIDDEGVSFTSHLDGSLHRFTPERSVEIQHALGADIFSHLTNARRQPNRMRINARRWSAPIDGPNVLSKRIDKIVTRIKNRRSSASRREASLTTCVARVRRR